MSSTRTWLLIAWRYQSICGWSLRLPLTGIDLRRTPEGDWYCFEANPSPAFTYYERLAGQPMTAAVASYLLGGASAGRA